MAPVMDVGEDAEPEVVEDTGDIVEEEPDLPSEDEPDVEEGCRSDDECEPGTFCDESVEPPECQEGCQQDENCPQGTVCDQSVEPAECREGCRTDAECPADTVCSSELRQCVDGCVDDEDCLEGEVCEEESQGCVGLPCQNDDDCSLQQFCDVEQTAHCVLGCRNDPDTCEDGFFCDLMSHLCQDGCGDNESCPQDEYCDLNIHLCKLGCRNDSECLNDEVCEEVRIDNGPPGQVCVPPSCDRDRSCANEEYCGLDDATNRMACLPGCRTERDNCGRGFSCDPGSRECEQELCEQDSDCSGGSQICGEGAFCQVGCRVDGDCQVGQFCGVDAFRCTCEVPDDCGQEQTCDEGFCVESCQSDRDCFGGARCDLDFNVCIFGCRDDAFEPNNALFEATQIEVSIFEGRMCFEQGFPEESQDCYRLDLFEEADVGSTLRVSLSFSHEDGDLNLVLIDPDFVEVRSETQEDGEQVDGLVEFLGTWFVCVVPAGDVFGSTYGMNVETVLEE